MIMNDIGGVPLKSVIPPKGFDIDEFLDVAIRIGKIYNYEIIFFIAT